MANRKTFGTLLTAVYGALTAGAEAVESAANAVNNAASAAEELTGTAHEMAKSYRIATVEEAQLEHAQRMAEIADRRERLNGLLEGLDD